jgi:acyl-CoA synthetase (AMP-forming)/AMP-acid ligase II
MSDFLIQQSPSAYAYPLLIKHLLHAPMSQAAGQEIVYRDISRYSYRDLRERIGRLASALTTQGVVRGDVVGVLDWGSRRVSAPRAIICKRAGAMHEDRRAILRPRKNRASDRWQPRPR